MRTPFPDWLQDWDVQTFLTLHRWMHDVWLHDVMRFANELGNAYVLLPVYLGLTALETDWRRGVRRAIHLALAMVLVSWATDVLKGSIDRSRPFGTCTEAFQDGSARIMWNDARGSRSCPSGHTSTAVTWISVLFFWTGGIAIRWRRWVARVGLVLLGTAAGLARIFTGAHFPLDVLFGAVLAILGAWLMALLVSLLKRDGPLASPGAPGLGLGAGPPQAP